MPRLRQPPQQKASAKEAVEEHLEDQNAGGDVLIEEPPAEEEVVVEDEVPAEVTSLKKQVEDLTRAEAAAKRNAEEQSRLRAEAERRANDRQQEFLRSQQEARDANKASVENALAAAQSEADKAEQDFVSAAEIGDYAGQAKAQRRIAAAAAKIEKLEENKATLEAQPKVEPQRQQESGDPMDAALRKSGLPQSAQDWLKRHPEYFNDARKNAKIQSLHYDVIEDGKAPFSPEYFEAIEEHLGMRQKTQIEDDEEPVAPVKKQPVSVQAPVSRDAVGLSGTRQTVKYKPTPADYKAAKISGVPVEEYVKQKLKLAQMRAEGTYGG